MSSTQQTPTIRGDQSGPHTAPDSAKDAFLAAVTATLGQAHLACDLSGYGEGGWHESYGSLDDIEIVEIALKAWYAHLDVPAPAGWLLHQEAKYVSARLAHAAGSRAGELEQLRAALNDRAWSDQTSANPEQWRNSSRTSTGQCAVTALVVQDRFGGELLRVPLQGDSHYFNLLPDGVVVDLTRDQFDAYEPIGPAETRTREYLLSNESTATRYQILRQQLSR